MLLSWIIWFNYLIAREYSRSQVELGNAFLRLCLEAGRLNITLIGFNLCNDVCLLFTLFIGVRVLGVSPTCPYNQ
jgi:hypothetical protein